MIQMSFAILMRHVAKSVMYTHAVHTNLEYVATAKIWENAAQRVRMSSSFILYVAYSCKEDGTCLPPAHKNPALLSMIDY